MAFPQRSFSYSFEKVFLASPNVPLQPRCGSLCLLLQTSSLQMTWPFQLLRPCTQLLVICFRDCRLASIYPPHPSDPSPQLPLGFPAASLQLCVAWPLIGPFQKAWQCTATSAPVSGLCSKLFLTVPRLPPGPPKSPAPFPAPGALLTAAFQLLHCSFAWLGHWSRLSTRLGSALQPRFRDCRLAPAKYFFLRFRDCRLAPPKALHPSLRPGLC